MVDVNRKLKNIIVLTAVLTLIPFSQAEPAKDTGLRKDALEWLSPLPEKYQFKKSNPGTPEKLLLGKMLFFDTRLSKSNVFSCASCHNLATGGVDNNRFSTGHKWQTGGRNAPTVLNASLRIAQFWDGRAADVEAQAQDPILAGVEMAATKELVLERLNSIPQYVERFKKAFPNEKMPLTYENIANAIGAYERTLITPSRFDRFLKGDDNALSRTEKKGLKTFLDKGCSTCHDGAAVGGGSYRKFGEQHQPPNMEDKGRFNVTKDEDDINVFVVPSLRNIELTYPYFHDGRHWTLEAAVKDMGYYQLDEKLSKHEIGDIVAFLKSLTGDAVETTIPILPPSTARTPVPDRN